MASKRVTENVISYKLYVSENAVQSNLKIKYHWDEANDGVFSLSEQNINRLIENALNLDYKFDNNKFTAGKNHGKSIANSLKNLATGFNKGNFEDFVSLFKILTFSEFIKNDKESEKYRERAKRAAEISFLNFDSYVFYFWNGEDVGRAIIDIEITSDNSWNDLNIQYYDVSQEGETWIAIPIENLPSEDPLEGFVYTTGNKRHIFIPKQHPTFIILHSEDGDFLNRSFFCTYSTTYRGHLLSGTGILEKKEPVSSLEAITKPVDPKIYNTLFQRANLLQDDEEDYAPKAEEKNFSYESEFIRNGKHFIGIYKGFYLDKDFEGDKKTIRILLLQIESSGKVRVYDGEVGDELTGFCSLPEESQIMYITCDFKFEVGGIPRFQIIIDMPQEIDSFIKLKGVYGGYSRNNEPYIGLIMLERIDGITTIEEALPLNSPKNFPTELQTGEIFHKLVSQSIIDFFIESIFYNSPDVCINEEIRNSYSSVSSKKYNGPTGVFYAYSSSSREIGIVRYPVFIDQKGIAKIKTAHDFIETGKALSYLFDNYIILNFYKPDLLSNNRPDKGVFVFRTSHQKNFKTVPGVSLRINDEDKVQAKREFLVPVSSATGITVTGTLESIFDALKFKIILPTNIDNLEEKMPTGLMEVLLGREYNLMVLSNETNKQNKVIHRHDFRGLYFIQALFEYQKSKELFLKGEPSVLKKVSYLVKQSIQHGIYNLKIFESLLNEYCEVYSFSKENISKDIQPIFDNLLEEYNSINI